MMFKTEHNNLLFFFWVSKIYSRKKKLGEERKMETKYSHSYLYEHHFVCNRMARKFRWKNERTMGIE